jgi:hypothetical protein
MTDCDIGGNAATFPKIMQCEAMRITILAALIALAACAQPRYCLIQQYLTDPNCR